MNLVPAFDFERVFLAPWTTEFAGSGWIMLMGFFVILACGLVGNYLILRRMALVGDAISHSVLLGIVVAFLVSGSRNTAAMLTGAMAAGIVTSVIIEMIHKHSRVKQDAAIGITFTSMFALGVILISLFAHKVDLDQECVLYGEIGMVEFETPILIGQTVIGPGPVVIMGVVTLVTGFLIYVFYKELLVTSFDPALAVSLGMKVGLVHYALMALLSVVVVSAFESVGAILVIAMLILPGATAMLCTQRLVLVHWLTVLQAAICSVGGLHLALLLDCSVAGAMVIVGTLLFALAWAAYVIRNSPWFQRGRHAGIDSVPDPEAG